MGELVEFVSRAENGFLQRLTRVLNRALGPDTVHLHYGAEEEAFVVLTSDPEVRVSVTGWNKLAGNEPALLESYAERLVFVLTEATPWPRHRCLLDDVVELLKHPPKEMF